MRRPFPVFAFFLVIALAVLASGMTPTTSIAAGQGPDSPRAAEIRREATRLLDEMTLREKAAQVLLVGISGRGMPDSASLDLVSGLPVGGVILFGFNLSDDAAELGLMSGALQDAGALASRGIPLFVAIDHEGGSVFRFRSGGVTQLPPPAEVGRRGPRYAASLGGAAGAELRALGVNLALAPVVELLTQENARVLGNRAYGRDAKTVDTTAGAFIRALQSTGVAAAAKHFPGNAGIDPHRGSARLEVDRETLERDYVARFESAIRAGVGAIVLSHVQVAALDPRAPASLSPLVVQGLLKAKLGFRGVAITDDLYMRALVSDSYPERAAVEALRAGADLLMLSTGKGAARFRDAIVRAVEAGSVPRERLDDAVLRGLSLKLRFAMESALDPTERRIRLAAFPALVERDKRFAAVAPSH